MYGNDIKTLVPDYRDRLIAGESEDSIRSLAKENKKKPGLPPKANFTAYDLDGGLIPLAKKELQIKDVLDPGKYKEAGFKKDEIRTMAKNRVEGLIKLQNEMPKEIEVPQAKTDWSDVEQGAGDRFLRGGEKAVNEMARGYSKMADHVMTAENTPYFQKMLDDHVNLDSHATMPSDFTTRPDDENHGKLYTQEDSTFSKNRKLTIDDINAAQKAYHDKNPDSWDVAGFLGEMGGGIIDPVNVVGVGAKFLDSMAKLSATGAVSGGIAAHGGDRDMVEGAALGAVATPIIGGALIGAGKGISKLRGKPTPDTPTPKAEEAQTPEVINDAIHQDAQAKDPAPIPDELAFMREQEQAVNKQFMQDMQQEANVLHEADVRTTTEAAAIKQAQLETAVKLEKEGIPAAQMEAPLKAIEENIRKVLPEDIRHSDILNDGKPLNEKFIGLRANDMLQAQINNPVFTAKEIHSKAKAVGMVDEMADAFSKAYAARDAHLFDTWQSEKLSRPHVARYEELQKNLMHDEHLAARENITAKDAYHDNRLVSKRGVTENGDYYAGNYEKNHAADFELTKQDVADIRAGKLNENNVQKLDNDLGRYDNDPLYREEALTKEYDYLVQNAKTHDEMIRLSEVERELYPDNAKEADEWFKSAEMAQENAYSHMRSAKIVNPFHKDIYGDLLETAKFQIARGADTLETFTVAMKEVFGDMYVKIQDAVADIFQHAEHKVERWAQESGQRGVITRSIIGRQYAMPLEKKYLNKSTGMVKEGAIAKDAEVLPPAVHTLDTFAKPFGGKSEVNVNTPIGDVKIDVARAFNHLQKNTYSEDRRALSGTIHSTLKDPLWIVDNPVKKQTEFYKPYKDDKGVYHLQSVTKKYDGKLEYKTTMDKHLGHIKQMIEVPDGNLKYFKYDNPSYKGESPTRFPTDTEVPRDRTSNTQGVDNSLDDHIIPDKSTDIKNPEGGEGDVTLYGGIPKPLIDGVFKPFSMLQDKALDILHNVGKIKRYVVEARVAKVSKATFKEETGVNAKDAFTDHFSATERYGDYEIDRTKSKAQIYRIAERDVYKESWKNIAKVGFFDNLDDDFVKTIHTKNAMEADMQTRAAKHFDILEKMSDDDQVMLSAYLDGSYDDLVAANGDKYPKELPAHLESAQKEYRAIIDERTKMLIKQGFLKEDDQIKDYLKRFYLPYLAKQSALEKFTERFLSMKSGTSSAAGGIMQRKDLSFAERVKKGQLFRASYTIPTTMMEQEKLLIRGKFYDDIAEKFATVEKLEGYRQIPGDNWQFGNLAGKHVPIEVYDAVVKAPEMIQGGMRYYLDVMSHFKVNKTVKNPFTHLYNVASNVELMALSHTSPASFYRGIKAGKWKEMVARAESYGLIDDTNLANNLDEVISKIDLKDIGEDDASALYKTLSTIYKNGLYFTADSKSGKFLRDAYNWEDKIFKIIAMEDNLYQKKLSKYEAATGERVAIINDKKADIDAIELSKDEMYEAFEEANRLFIDYQRPLPPAWRAANLLIPFTNYAVKSTPIVLEQILKNPLTAMSLNIAGGGIVARGAAAGAGVAGFSGLKEMFEEQYIDMDEHPHSMWMENNVRIPFTDAEVPFDNLMGVESWRPLSVEDKEYAYFFNQGRMIQGMRADFMDSAKTMGMLGMVIGYAKGEDLKTGRNYWEKEADDWENFAMKSVPKIWSNFMPSMSPGGTFAVKSVEAVKDGENRYGEPMDLADVFLQSVGIRKVHKARAQTQKLKEVNEKINNVENYDKKIKRADKKLDQFHETNRAKGYSPKRHQEVVEAHTKKRDKYDPQMDGLLNLKSTVENWTN